jgi:hypothetical protein
VVSAVIDGPGGHPVLELIDAARAMVRGFADLALWTVPEKDLPAAVAAALGLVAQAQSVLLGVIGEAIDRGVPASIGSPSPTAWLRDRHKVHPGEAARLVRTAAALRGDGLPATSAALAAGAISLPHVHGIRRACADLPDDLDPQVAASVEARMVQDAEDFDPIIAGRLARHVLSRVDPDGEDRRDGERLARAERRAAATNELGLTPDGDGGMHVRGRLDADGHAIVDTALQPLMAPQADTGEGPDRRSVARRRADALVELCRRALAGGDLPSHGGAKPQVVVTVPYRTLTDSLGVGMLPTGEPISPAAARHWACDAGIIAAVLDANSRPLDVTDEKRLFEGRLRRALEIRDRGCAFPGCDRPIAWCEGHHIQAWADGGTTCLTNGVLLCRHHHRTVEHGDWTVRIHTDGFPIWRPPPWVDPQQKPVRNHTHRPDLPAV